MEPISRKRKHPDSPELVVSSPRRILTGDPKRPGRHLGRSRPRSPESDSTTDPLHTQRAQENLRTLQQGLVLPESTYTYSDIAPNEIRLLHLLPAGSKTDTINCVLKVVKLEDAMLHYEALSYTWGYEEPTEEIRVQQPKRSLKEFGRALLEHKTFYVRPNLAQALRHLRDCSDEGNTEILWVDALCINQKNETEKSMQVAKMAHIYRRADSVFIWLGKEKDDSDLGMDFVKRILNLERQGELSVKGSSPKQWASFISLMQREWFSRRWVIQELALAKNAYLTCGDHAVNWKDFVVAVEFFIDRFETISGLYNDSIDFKQKLLSLGDIRAFGAGRMMSVTNNFVRPSADDDFEQLKGLELLVSELTMFEGSDPRDTIYALMSLASDTPSPLVPSLRTRRPPMQQQALYETDYKKNILQVFKDFTAFCIHKSGSLNIICRKWAPNRRPKQLTPAERMQFRGRRPPTETIILPSWIGLLVQSAFGIPRSGPKTRIAGDSLVGSPDSRQYNASGKWKANVCFGEVDADENCKNDESILDMRNPDVMDHPSTYKVSAEETIKKKRGRKSDGTLYVRGFKINTIEQISHRLYEGMIPREWLELGGWRATTEGDDEDNLPDGLWRTLVGDRTPDGAPPPGWYPVALSWAIERRGPNGDIHTAELIRQGQPPRMVDFLRRVQDVVWDKRFFLLSAPSAAAATNGTVVGGGSASFGVAPPQARAGDIVAVLLGCSVPVVLRPVDEDDSRAGFELVGEAYIYGMMDGEALAPYAHYGDEYLDQYSAEFCLV